MTDLAQPVEIATTPHRASMSTPSQDPGNLSLNPSNNPNPATITVYVYTFTGTSTVAGFALSRDAGTFFTGGLHWDFQPGSTYALFVTFRFLQNTSHHATSISCTSLSYSAPHGGVSDDKKQDLCIPPVSTGSNPYQFTVWFSDRSKHDPEIVVTPIPS